MRAPEKFFYTNDELAKELFAAARKLIDIGLHLQNGFEIAIKYERFEEES